MINCAAQLVLENPYGIFENSEKPVLDSLFQSPMGNLVIDCNGILKGLISRDGIKPFGSEKLNLDSALGMRVLSFSIVKEDERKEWVWFNSKTIEAHFETEDVSAVWHFTVTLLIYINSLPVCAVLYEGRHIKSKKCLAVRSTEGKNFQVKINHFVINL